jgi:hypothetical protein
MLDCVDEEELKRLKKAAAAAAAREEEEKEEEDESDVDSDDVNIDRTVIDSTFGGQICSSVRCDECGTLSRVKERVFDLS